MSGMWFDALGEPVPDHRREAAVEAARDMGVRDGLRTREWVDNVAAAIERDMPDTALSRARQHLDVTGAFRLIAHLCVDDWTSEPVSDSDDDEPLFDERDRRTFEAAVDTWGVGAQIDMAEEECAEYIVASKHYGRERADLDAVIDEVADLRIMVEQLSLALGPERTKRRVQFKMDRLRERLADEGVDVDGGDGG